MTDPDERRYFPLWSLKAMYDHKPADKVLRVHVRHIGGFQIVGRVINIDTTLTIRSDSGMILEDVRAEHIDRAEII